MRGRRKGKLTVGAGLSRIALNFRDEGLCDSGDSDSAIQDIGATDPLSIHGPVAAVVGRDDGTVEADASKNAAAPGVSQNFGVHFEVGRGRSVTAHGSGSGSGIGANLELIAEQALKAFAIAKDQDKIRRGAANLKTETSAADGEKNGSAPAIVRATGGQTFSVAGAENEGGLQFAWNDGDAFRGFEQFIGNALVRCLHELMKNVAGDPDAGDVIAAIISAGGRARYESKENYGDNK